MGRIYLVRHGRTAWNSGEVFRGTADVSLDDTGRMQAELVAGALAVQAPDAARVLCSPLSRASETASVVAGKLGLKAEADERLTDIDVGEWSGSSLQEVSSRYPGLYEEWARTPHLFRFPGGGTLAGVQGCAWRVVEEALAMLPGLDVIVVSHRLTLKTIILKALGAGLERFWRVRLDTASISSLELGEQGTEAPVVVSRLNHVSHLAPLKLPDRRDF